MDTDSETQEERGHGDKRFEKDEYKFILQMVVESRKLRRFMARNS
jgi:hypothetical protein